MRASGPVPIQAEISNGDQISDLIKVLKVRVDLKIKPNP